MGDIGPVARVAFAGVYLLVQGALIATAGRRPEHAFGFRLFGESTIVRVSLARELDDGGPREIAVTNGTWIAHDAAGLPRRIDWRERVRVPELATFDAAVQAPAGAAATLVRLQSALDDVATHTPEDVDTRVLVADVVIERNGREPYAVRLRSVRR